MAIQITSIPITSLLIESVSMNITVLTVSYISELDPEKKKLLSSKMDSLKVLLNDLSLALNHMENDKGKD